MMTDLSFMSLNMIISVLLFGLSLLIPLLAVLSTGLRLRLQDAPEIMIKHALFFNVGCLFLTGFMGQLFYGPEIAAVLGWPWSPFQDELAFSELALSLLGLICPLFKREFWLATIIAASTWLIGGSAVHLYYLALGSQELHKAGFAIGWNLFIAFWIIALYVLYDVLARKRALKNGHDLSQLIGF